MNFTGCLFAMIIALCLVAIIAAYRHINELENALFSVSDRNRKYNKLIARYEVAIQSMPEDIREKILRKIYEEIKRQNDLNQ
jgi:hypothetical protein